MEKIFYNKLIRDNIPDKMEKKGSAFEINTLGNEEFEEELIKKVEEEASGLQNSKSKEDFVAEIADIMDVVDEIKKIKNISNKEIKEKQKKNFEKKGGFDKKIFLVWSEKDDYKSNEIRR